MANYNFRKDLIIGSEGEEAVLDVIKKTFPLAHKVDKGFHPEYDLIIPEIDKTVEVKNDVMAAKTGNLAIECSKKSGAKSGIMISTADFWVIIAANEMLLMGRTALLNYIENNKFRKVWGGDRWEAEMWLIPIKQLKEQKFLRLLTSETKLLEQESEKPIINNRKSTSRKNIKKAI